MVQSIEATHSPTTTNSGPSWGGAGVVALLILFDASACTFEYFQKGNPLIIKDLKVGPQGFEPWTKGL